ncbi:MAG TPA: prepilin-type N-terminal cleavage/methylation domain-containing protein [Dongiaceae bacterium]|nr:prepilin-type N-terminal cleavage/methylation domain-containing protein [Dongiaceae bacterium]
MQYKRNYERGTDNRGFTIVELLIVVVVIAILAAITIVAYNGVTNRAKASAAASAAEQAAKKVLIYTTTNSDQTPPDLATAGVTDQNGTTYQYSTNTSATPQAFCITATTNNISYFINNTTQTSPIAGACPGHGVNGVAPITNLFLNPSAQISGSSATWGGNFGTNGAGTILRTAGADISGGSFMHMAWTTAATQAYRGIEVYANSGLQPSATYTASAWIRCSFAQTFGINILWLNSSGTGISQGVIGTPITVQPNVWTRVSVTDTSPAGTVGARFNLYAGGTGAQNWPAGATLDGDAAMLTAGSSLPNYADGDSTGWAWTGSQGNSTSTGPAL